MVNKLVFKIILSSEEKYYNINVFKLMYFVSKDDYLFF